MTAGAFIFFGGAPDEENDLRLTLLKVGLDCTLLDSVKG